MNPKQFYNTTNLEDLAAGLDGVYRMGTDGDNGGDRDPATRSGDNALSTLIAQRQRATKATLSTEALQGLVGEIVRAIEPHTEADPVATLANTVTAFGNVIGPIPYFRVEHSRHYLNMFVALVGETSKGRKGTSWSSPKRMLADIDSIWAASRITGGLSSGRD